MSGRKYSALLIFLTFVFFSCNPPDEEVVYDYSLTDINSSSFTYGENIGPGDFENQVTVHYFGHQTWPLCTDRVGNLDDLYQDLLDNGINNVQIITIGKTEFSSKNGDWTNGTSLPVLIDPSPYTTWSNWGAEQRDIFFLDSDGNYVTDFNISSWDYERIYTTILDLSSQ